MDAPTTYAQWMDAFHDLAQRPWDHEGFSVLSRGSMPDGVSSLSLQQPLVTFEDDALRELSRGLQREIAHLDVMASADDIALIMDRFMRNCEGLLFFCGMDLFPQRFREDLEASVTGEIRKMLVSFDRFYGEQEDLTGSMVAADMRYRINRMRNRWESVQTMTKASEGTIVETSRT